MDILEARGTPSAYQVAFPALRFCVWTEGGFDQPDCGAAALAVFDAVMESLGGEIGYLTLIKPTAGKRVRLTRATPKKREEARAAVAAGMPAHRHLSADAEATLAEGARGVGLPALDLSHLPGGPGFIGLDMPLEHPAAMGLIARLHQIMDGVPLVAGVCGYGFAMVPGDFGQYKLPPAHLRFRTALMAPVELLSREVRYDAPFVQMRRLSQRRDAKGATIPEAELFDYQTGLPDIGWRTYLGADLCARVDAQEGLETKLAALVAQGGAVEERAGHRVVTASPAPVWGDLNAGEPIAGYIAARAYLEPALASRSIRLMSAPCHDTSDKDRMREAEAYVDRFKEEGA
ncbi:hypothetical protein CEW89_04895 [Celeribacter ethanolicus]|uniref:DUF3396 domain-containing protein n=1 Tax=Celeribacter ethanolicus TaxID=1758178 RepID=A0A291G8T5_9RHOB|nr:hypothetical protein [Celeribacter ethanolicus]ATG46963.1 hypothetical protein CEW89_04895 [Celeribacter ethanolicus]